MVEMINLQIEVYYPIIGILNSNFIFLFSISLLFLDFTRSLVQVFVLNSSKIKDEKIIPNLQYHPKVSVLIPAYRADRIVQTIKSVINTSYENKEILVIVNGNDDETYQKAKSIEQSYPDFVSVFNLHSRGKALALNHGRKKAEGEIIITLDADSKIIDPYSLTNIVKKLENNREIIAMSGDVQIYPGDNCANNFWTKLQAIEYLLIMHIGKRFQTIFDSMLIIPGGFGVFKETYLRKENAFNEESVTEDFVISLDVHAYGKKVAFEPSAVARFECPNNFSKFIAQRIRWSYGQFETLKAFKNISNFPRNKKYLKLGLVDMWTFSIGFNMLWSIFIIGLLPSLFSFSLVDLYLDQSMMEVNPLITIINTIENPIKLVNFQNNISILVFLILSYLGIESISFLTAIKLSKKSEYRNLLWALPFYVFVYKPFNRILICRGHILAILKKKPSWYGKKREESCPTLLNEK